MCHGVPMLGRYLYDNLITELPANAFADALTKLTELYVYTWFDCGGDAVVFMPCLRSV